MKTAELTLLQQGEGYPLPQDVLPIVPPSLEREDLREWRSHPLPENRTLPFWDATSHQLHKTTFFQQATPREKWLIRQALSQHLLTEIYCLKQIGREYMGKMARLSPTSEEQVQYTLFCADETYHLTQLRKFFHPPEHLGMEYLWFRLLQNTIRQEEQPLLLFVIQVFLKGWTVTYYQQLIRECCHHQFAQILTGFLPQESFYHITGITRYKQQGEPYKDLPRLTAIMTDLLALMEWTPHPVLAIAEQMTGYLTPRQKQQLQAELNLPHYHQERWRRMGFLLGKEKSGILLSLAHNSF